MRYEKRGGCSEEIDLEWGDHLMGRGELVVVLGNTGHFIQVVHQSANGWGRDCVALYRMNKSTVTQKKLCN